MSESVLTETENQQARQLLDELAEIKGPGRALDFWIIKARTLLVFAAIKNPELLNDY